MSILQVANIKKRFGTINAVEDVSFEVQQGCCFGLLGPNGAGKTTTMEIIENIIEPTSGSVLYRGAPRKNSFRQEIGIQFQHTSLLNFLSVKETLSCYLSLYQNTEDIDWLIDRCDLGPVLNQRNNQLSGGQRQRLMLALALVNRPELIFLDEPSTGLDPQARRYLWEIVNEIKKDGKTVIMTTHSMEEAQYLCDTIAIMDRGLIIAEGSPSRLIATYCRNDTITLPREAVEAHFDCLDMDCQVAQQVVSIQTTTVEATLTKLISCGVDLSQMSVRSANLEDVFLFLTGKHLRD